MIQQSLPTSAEAVAISTTRDFIFCFPMEFMPFCPVGMEHLHSLARTNPSLYDWSREYLFVNMDHPEFSGTTLGEHYDTCADCNASC